MLRLLYTFAVGIPLYVLLVTGGLFLCLTVIGLPFGLTLIALGFKSLMLQPRPRVQVYHGVGG